MANPEFPSLVIDSWGPETRVGWLDSTASFPCLQSGEPALESLFHLIGSLLDHHRAEIRDIRSFLFCEGPGSVLGLRLASMAIHTWQGLTATPPPVYQYRALSFSALALSSPASSSAGKPTFQIWTDWKKSRVRVVRSPDPFRIETVDTAALREKDGPLYYLPQRKSWHRDPDLTRLPAPYPFEMLPSYLSVPGFLTHHPRPFLPETEKNTYATWSGERHRAHPG